VPAALKIASTAIPELALNAPDPTAPSAALAVDRPTPVNAPSPLADQIAALTETPAPDRAPEPEALRTAAAVEAPTAEKAPAPTALKTAIDPSAGSDEIGVSERAEKPSIYRPALLCLTGSIEVIGCPRTTPLISSSEFQIEKNVLVSGAAVALVDGDGAGIAGGSQQIVDPQIVASSQHPCLCRGERRRYDSGHKR